MAPLRPMREILRRAAPLGLVVVLSCACAGGGPAAGTRPVSQGTPASRAAATRSETPAPTRKHRAKERARSGAAAPQRRRHPGRPRGAAAPRPRATPLSRPRIVWKPIPFSAARLAETAAYAKRHYGIDSFTLRDPRVIVEHYTASSTFASAYAIFSQDVPDAELHELPGTCAHFVVDRDGTVYQLVPLAVICRHTVGLNWTAIGIEHVGTSDQEILADPAQLRASLELTAWLMQRYRIALGNVIGHAESLESRYHHERYAGWRCQTHGDWQHADMEQYRARLRALLARAHAFVGGEYTPVASGC
jgi:N-acetylmuramoyl-L-alanine amidase